MWPPEIQVSPKSATNPADLWLTWCRLDVERGKGADFGPQGIQVSPKSDPGLADLRLTCGRDCLIYAVSGMSSMGLGDFRRFFNVFSIVHIVL